MDAHNREIMSHSPQGRAPSAGGCPRPTFSRRKTALRRPCLMSVALVKARSLLGPVCASEIPRPRTLWNRIRTHRQPARNVKARMLSLFLSAALRRAQWIFWACGAPTNAAPPLCRPHRVSISRMSGWVVPELPGCFRRRRLPSPTSDPLTQDARGARARDLPF